MNYNICGIPITKEHALRIAKQSLYIHTNFPRGGHYKEQDQIDIEKARQDVLDIEKDIKTENDQMDIYKELSKAGCDLSSHCSDLYVPVNEVSRDIVNRYRYKGNVTTFKSEIDGVLHFDIPFAYYPYHTKACMI